MIGEIIKYGGNSLVFKTEQTKINIVDILLTVKKEQFFLSDSLIGPFFMT